MPGLRGYGAAYRPGKAQPPPGTEAGTAPDAPCRAALRLPGLPGYGAACRPGKAQPPPGTETGTAQNTHCR
ncbi:hypothetical protein EGJ61_11090 [Klebsiella quasipneumoniae]|nr:hypothetical protein EGJ61_11090 [Klebsiella quasipneumoniae]